MKSSASDSILLRPGYFLPYQVAWLKDRSRFKIFEKSRRIGGTYVQSYEDVRDLVEDPHLPAVWFSSADLSAAAEYIDYCAKWAKVFNVAAQNHGFAVLDEDKDIKAYTIELAGGKKIHALSSNPKAFRSKGGKLVLDEYAWHDDADKMWSAAKPIVTWGYPVRLLSTHNGINSRFNRFVKDAKKAFGKFKWALHTVTIQRAVEDGLVDKILRRAATAEEKADWLETEHATCGDESTWLQEYCCQPTDENSAFLTYEMLAAVQREDILVDDLSNVQGDLYAGMDIARRNHLSIFWVYEKLGHLLFTRKVKVMRKMSFADQKREVFPILAHPKMRRAAMDEGGLGMQFVEEAQAEFGKFKVEAVNFGGSKVKEELAYGLYTDIEDRTLFIPVDDRIRESMHSVRKVTTTAGNIRFDAVATDKSGHGDDFWAAALARHAARDKNAGPVFAESAGRDDDGGGRVDLERYSSFNQHDLNSY